jgi:hypothetical protein
LLFLLLLVLLLLSLLLLLLLLSLLSSSRRGFVPHVGSRLGFVSSRWSDSSGGSSGQGGRASSSSIGAMCGRVYLGHLPVTVYLPNYGAIVGRMMRRVGLTMFTKRLVTPQQLVASLTDRVRFEDSFRPYLHPSTSPRPSPALQRT